MSLINCPECGHEVSNSAVACPACGRPLAARPVIERNHVMQAHHDGDGFPKWAFIPLGLITAALLLVLFIAMGRNDDSTNSNLAVNVSASRASLPTSSQSSTVNAEPRTLSVPPSSSSQPVTVPPDAPPQSTTIAPSSNDVGAVSASSRAGTVIIDAKISARTGAPRAVKNERFYLLDQQLETILSEAGLDPIEGQTLANSLGLSVFYPDRYGDFNRGALAAIKDHIKYVGQTDAGGKAQLGNVEPNSYFLFGVTKTASGFVVWSAPVTVSSGQNLINLAPQPVTEIESGTGD